MGEFWWISKGCGSNVLPAPESDAEKSLRFLCATRCDVQNMENVEVPQSFLVAAKLLDSF